MDIDSDNNYLNNNLSDESSEIVEENYLKNYNFALLSNNYNIFFQECSRLNLNNKNIKIDINDININNNDPYTLKEFQNDNNYGKKINRVIKRIKSIWKEKW